MSDKIFQVPGQITKIETMAKGLRLKVDTQENLSVDAKGRLLEVYDHLGWFTFSAQQIEPEDLLELPKLKIKSKRSKGQLQRNILYRLWEQDNQGMEDSEEFYNYHMDKINNWLKEKLA